MSIIQPRTETVTIYQGDYLARIRHLEQRYEAAIASEEQGPKRNGHKSEVPQIAEEHAALVKEAEASAVNVVVGTVRRSVYRVLADQHPPREGNEGDKHLGINAVTFREVLVPAAILKVGTGDDLTDWADLSDGDREEFLDSLADSDFERLFAQAYGLVNGFVTGPKGLPSRTTSKPDES